MIKYNLPLFIQMNVDEDGNRVSTEVLNEQIKVVNNTTFLSGVPDEYYRVNVGGVFVEIDISEEITTANQFKCNYQTGQLWFHSSRSGETITVVRYYSYGVIFYPSDRIYTETSGGSVTQTLQDVINTSKMVWKNPVASYSLITPTYPSPTDGWTVQTLDNNKIYRYDGTTWQWIQTINVTNAFIKNSDTSDNITQGTTNLFVTSAEKATWNGGSLNATSFGTFLNGLTEKTTPVDADMVGVMDSEATNISKKLSWANIKSNILSYINTATATFTNKTLTSPVISTIVNTGTLTLPTTTGTLVGRTTTDTLTNKTLTAPKMTSASYIADSNGNELIKFPSAVASAVNEITISNAITGAAPTVATTGTDTNINLNLISKGTGTVQANGYDVLTANTNTTITPTITTGTNSVIRKTDNIESFPKFTMQGKSYTNLLGKDGNCEDVSKWTAGGITPSLDSANKVFGANGTKLTLSVSAGYYYKTVSSISTMDVSKYYLISAYLKNGNATNAVLYKDNTGGGTAVVASGVTNTTGFTRIGIVVQPSQIAPTNLVCVNVNGASTQYAYADGIQINEITSTEYALGATALLDKYPYIDSYACLQNPYIEVRHDNLVRNGNGEDGIGWWAVGMGAPTISVVNGKFRIICATVGDVRQRIPVKPNTNYYLSGNISGSGQIYIYDGAYTTQLRLGSGTFNTGNNAFVLVLMGYGSAFTGDFDSIMLIEGATPPTTYKPCRIERCVVEGKFTSDDTFILENGEVSGLLNWKHRTLFGKDYDWQYALDQALFKEFKIPQLVGMNNIIDSTSNYIKAVKYDGRILSGSADVSSNGCGTWNDGYFYISIPDSDTGFAEAIAPNADEVKAFMNGWKAMWNDNNRYTMFQSIVDKSLPAITVQAPISATTNTTTITVSSGGTQFVSGETIVILTSALGVRAVGIVTGTPTATSVPVTTSISVVSGDILAKKDNGGSGIVTLLTYCKNNIAPNYEGYQIHYKLQNPEPITDVNTHIHGDIIKFSGGNL